MRKRWLVVWAASLFLLSISYAQKEDAGYFIVSHHARLQLFPAGNSISCTDTLTVRLSGGKENISIGLLPVYNIERVTVNGKKGDFSRRQDHIEIEDVPSDSQAKVVISYSGALNFRSEFSQMNADRAVLREEEILPYGPKQLESIRFTIIVPKEWETMAAGKLVSTLNVQDSTTYVWELNGPLPTIGWICAGKFLTTSDANGNVPVSVSLFNEDSSYAARCLSVTHNVLKYYNSHFSPYRFPKLAIIEVDDWVAGKNVLAIAAPSFIMVKKLAFETPDVFNQFQSILPHEIAHQWWPMTVFVNDEDLALLSEGMCEYSALLYAQATGNMSSRDSLGNHPLLRSLLMRVTKGRDLPLQQKADLRSLPTHYLKASYVHNMLRKIVGDSVFSHLYEEFAKRFSLKKVGLKEFQEVVEDLSGKKLDWFFDQWVKKRGVPRTKLYNVKSTASNGTWIVKGRVRMLGYEKYTTFADVGIETVGNETDLTTVWLGIDTAGVYHNDVGFEVVTKSKPLRAKLDPSGDVLMLQKLPAKLGDLRDPSDGIMIVGTRRHASHLLELAQMDSMQMEDAGWSMKIKTDAEVTLSDLQQERVILYGTPEENSVAADQVLKFPISFKNDSVVVNKESFYDSTSALVQIIDNEYIAGGLMIWVAPLSEKAEPRLMPVDHSWAIMRGKDVLSSGTWEMKDEERVVEIR